MNSLKRFPVSLLTMDYDVASKFISFIIVERVDLVFCTKKHCVRFSMALEQKNVNTCQHFRYFKKEATLNIGQSFAYVAYARQKILGVKK